MKMKKILQWKLNRRYIHACIAGVFVVLLYMLLLRGCSIYPFGDNTWIMYDLKRQYIDFYSYYKTIIAGDNNILYSFSTALGSGLIGFFVYYLSDPLLLLCCLFPQEQLPLAITIIIGITLVLAAVIMDLFLQWYFSKEDDRIDGNYWLIFFSIAWAFSGFLIAHSMNIMWTDVVILVPIIIYFVENIIHSNKVNVGYIFVLCLLLLLNYYITFQILIFIGLWTLMRLFVLKSDCSLQIIGKLFISTIVSVGIDAIVLLPTLFELANSPKDITKLGLETAGKNLNPLDVFSKLYIFAYDVIQPRFGLPQLFCGTVIVLLLVMFFANKDIDKRERIGSATLLLIFLLSFCVDLLNLVWHAGMEPSGHPYRQAPLCVFLMIICSVRSFERVLDDKNSISLTRLILTLGALIGVLGLAFLHGYEYTSKKMVIINVLLIIFNGVLIYFINHSDKRAGSLLKILGGVLVIELLSNAIFTYPFIAMKCEKATEFSAKVHRDNSAVTLVENEDNAFFRMENLTPRQQNDSMMYNYNGITHYSSAGMTYVRYFLQKCGYNDDTLYTHYGHDNTATMDSILGVKYLITEDDNLVHTSYQYLNNLDGISVYRNPYYMSVAQVSDEFQFAEAESGDYQTISEISNPQNIGTDPFSLQEEIMQRLYGQDAELFISADIDCIDENLDGELYQEYEIVPRHNGELYLYIDNLDDTMQSMSLYLGDELLTSYGNASCYKILNLGYHTTGEVIRVKIVIEGDTGCFGDIIVVTEDTDRLEDIVSSLDSNMLNIEKLSSSHIQMNIPATSGIFTTIPYEEGWHISINGRKIIPDCIYGALMYIPTDNESGQLDMYFIPKGLVAGSIISCLSLLALVLFILVKNGKISDVRTIQKIVLIQLSVIILMLLSMDDRIKSTEYDDRVKVGTEHINIYEADGDKYLFLPSYADANIINWKNKEAKTDTIVLHSENIPAVFINTLSGNMNKIYADKEHKESGHIRVIEEDGNEAYNGKIQSISGRGNYSWDNWDKKSFSIEVSSKRQFLGLPSGEKYVLIANASDPTVIRNEISRRIELLAGIKYVPIGKYVDLYINGDYMGDYYLCSSIDVGDCRIDITNLEEEMDRLYAKSNYEAFTVYETPRIKGWNLTENPQDITGGYLIEREFLERYESEYANNPSGFKTKSGECFIVKSPKYCSKEEINYLSEYIQRVEDMIMSENIGSLSAEELEQYIDTDSFTGWYIASEVTKNYDAGISSTYYYKDSEAKDSRLALSSGWDYDMSLGNYLDWMEYYNQDGTGLTEAKSTESASIWMSRLYDNNTFRTMAIEKYRDSIRPYLDTLITNGIEEYHNTLQASTYMDSIRWNGMYNDKGYMIGSPGSYSSLREYIIERKNYLDTVWNIE